MYAFTGRCNLVRNEAHFSFGESEYICTSNEIEDLQ